MYKCSSYSTYSLHCSSFLWVNQFYIRDPKIYSPKKELQWRLYRYILAVFLGVDCQASSHTLNVLHPEVVTSLHNAQRSRDICSEITRSCSEITRRHASSREISRDLAISRDISRCHGISEPLGTTHCFARPLWPSKEYICDSAPQNRP